MIIDDFAVHVTGEARTLAATVSWEDHSYPEQKLLFEIEDDQVDGAEGSDEPLANAFLSACFPLAALHGEGRVRIEGRPCPMLVDGLRTVHAWWESWGGMPGPAPAIETTSQQHNQPSTSPKQAFCCLSGGVDGLHMLMRNRRSYRPDDPAYIRHALLIHGFDIGKRARDPENRRFRMAIERLQPLAKEVGIRLIPCRTNLRQLPTKPDFWTHRYNVAALAAVGHAATHIPRFLFIAGAYHLDNPVPMGSHPAVDGLFSSQRMRLVHEGARFSRVDKVRDLAEWPTALAALRVCPANVGDQPNCGVCEKCLGTRLELLAAGVEETAAFGPSLTPVELWEAAVSVPSGHRALRYRDLLPYLRARGLDELCRFLETKIAIYEERVLGGARWPGI